MNSQKTHTFYSTRMGGWNVRASLMGEVYIQRTGAGGWQKVKPSQLRQLIDPRTPLGWFCLPSVVGTPYPHMTLTLQSYLTMIRKDAVPATQKDAIRVQDTRGRHIATGVIRRNKTTGKDQILQVQPQQIVGAEYRPRVEQGEPFDNCADWENFLATEVISKNSPPMKEQRVTEQGLMKIQPIGA